MCPGQAQTVVPESGDTTMNASRLCPVPLFALASLAVPARAEEVTKTDLRGAYVSTRRVSANAGANYILPAAAIRHVLQDKRAHLLTIGMRLKHEIDANIKTLSSNVAYTLDDRALLAEFCAKAYGNTLIRKMRVE